MTIRSQNGWTVIKDPSSTRLREFVIPASSGQFTLTLRRGQAGFVLAHYALWHAEIIEPVAGAGDDFGWAPRMIADTGVWSNHASATAGDLNASQHPSGTRTYTDQMTARVHSRLSSELYATPEGPAIRWGGDYHTSVDQMHFELNVSPDALKVSYAACLASGRGQRILEVNP